MGTRFKLTTYLHGLGTSAVACDPPDGEDASTVARQWIKVDGSGLFVKVRSLLIIPIDDIRSISGT